MILNLLQLHSTAIDEDQDLGGQSADCEAPPPPYSASYTNLFDPNQDVPLGGSAHSLRNNITDDSPPSRRAVAPPHNLGPRHSPMGQRRRDHQQQRRPVDPYQAPMATPDQFSPNSPSPTGYNLPPTGYGGGHPVPAGVHMVKSASVERSLAADEKYPTNQALITDHSGALSMPRSGSHNRLTSAGAAAHNRGVRTSPVAQRYQRKPPTQPQPQHYTNGGSTAGSMASVSSGRPQHQHPAYRVAKESGYSSSSTQASFKPPPQPSSLHQHPHYQQHQQPRYSHHQRPHRPPSAAENRGVSADPSAGAAIPAIPGNIRRPMSFVRALEMSDAIASQERHRQHAQNVNVNTLNVSSEEDKNYGSTYEISV